MMSVPSEFSIVMFCAVAPQLSAMLLMESVLPAPGAATIADVEERSPVFCPALTEYPGVKDTSVPLALGEGFDHRLEVRDLLVLRRQLLRRRRITGRVQDHVRLLVLRVRGNRELRSLLESLTQLFADRLQRGGVGVNEGKDAGCVLGVGHRQEIPQ